MIMWWRKLLHRDQVVVDGNVAVLYSPGYGSGWSTSNTHHPYHQRCIFDPVLVEWVRDGKPSDQINLMDTYVYDVYGSDFYTGCNIENLEIAWVPQGTQFMVQEYDGSESIRTRDGTPWITA